MSTMQEILASTRKLIEVKKAEFNSNLAAEKKADDKALNNTGAGDDSPITRGHALDATQSALEPTKKPLITSDANANPPADGKGTKSDVKGKNEGNVTDRADKLEASDSAIEPKKEPLITSDANADAEAGSAGQTAKLANEILKDIRDYQQKKQAEQKPAPKAEEKKANEDEMKAPAKSVVAVVAKKGPEPKDEDKEEDKKEASGLQLELTGDVLAKIASIVLSTEEGTTFVEEKLAEQAGKEAAQEVLTFLAGQSELAEKQAAYEQGSADAEALIQQALFDAGRQAGIKEASEAQKQNLMKGLGQKVAQASIQDLMGAGAGAMEGGAQPDVPVEAMAGGAAPAPEMGAEMGAAGEEISEEDLMQALQALVQEGTIQPEEAQAVIAALTGGGEAGAETPAQEVAEEGPGAPAPTPEHEASESAGEEKKEEKESMDKTSALLDAIRQVRASRK